MRSVDYEVVMIGAGLTGLTASYRLAQKGVSVLVVDQHDKPGGVIQSVEKDGYLLESGPSTFQSTGQEIGALCQELNLTPLAANPLGKKRFVFHGNQLHPVPMGPGALLTTPLLSIPRKIALLSEPFKPSSPKPEETVASFTRRRLGQEVLDRLMTPFLSGVYAGDPEHMSLQATFPKLAQWEKNHGSILKGLIHSKRHNKKTQHKTPYQLFNFQHGMHQLPQALANALPEGTLQLDTKVVALEQFMNEAGPVYQLTFPTGEMISCRTLVLTTPAHVTARLINGFASRVSQSLIDIPYAPLSVVHLGIPKQQVHHSLDGFGFLIPRTEGLTLLGSIWVSQLFPNRAPEDHHLLSCFIGGALHPEVAAWNSEQCIRRVTGDLSRVLSPHQILQPSFAQVVHYPRAIPQYMVGHLSRVSGLHSDLQKNLRLYIGGNFMNGVSMNDCVIQGNQLAESIHPVSAPMSSVLV